MGRKSQFSNDLFLEAALQLVAECGPGGLTMSALAGRSGAPVGSLYHRYLSREVLLGELWLRVVESFQAGFLEVLEATGGLDAALYTPRWIRSHPVEGRVLLLYRREEFMAGEWPGEMRERAARLTRALDGGLRSFVRRRDGRITPARLRRVVFALIDVPSGAVLRYLQAGERPPAAVDALIRETYQTILRRSP